MKSVLLFISFLATIIATAQPITYSFQNQSGLSDNEVYDLEQDDEGFIWVAANNGLLRYNGSNYEKKDIPNQKGHAVFCLTKDKNNHIWFNNLYGQFFKITNNNITLMYDASKVLHGNLPEFRVLNNNRLLLFSNKGLLMVDSTGVNTVINTPILKGFETDSHYLLLDYKQHLLYINKKTLHKEKEIALPYTKISNPKFINYQNNTYLFFSENRKSVVLRIGITEVKAVKKTKPLNFAKLINIFNVNNEFWISDDSHVQVCTLKNDSITPVSTIFEGEKISDILVDSHENTWLATLQNGISVSPNNAIIKLSYNPLQSGYITGSAKLNYNEIVYYTDKGKLLFVNLESSTTTEVSIPSESSISTVTYNYLTDCLYIGCNTNESYLYNLSTKKIIPTNLFNVAKNITIAKNNVLYLTYNKSILYYNFGKENQTKVILENSRGYTSHYSTKNNCLIISTASGLKLYDKQGKHTTSLTYKSNIIYSNSIAETEDGTIYIASKNDGLFYIKKNKMKAYPLNLAGNNIHFIKSYGNELWIVTDKSIDVIIPKTKAHHKYGLRFGVINPVKTLEITDSQIYYTTNKAMFKANKKAFRNTKSNKPSLFFTGVSFMDKDTIIQQTYSLPYATNNLKFSFSANHFNSTEFIQYRYRLKGLENKWQTTNTAQNNVKYLAVPPGKYTFEIIPFFTDTLQEGSLKRIDIAINNPMWLQWWFGLLCILSVVLFIFGIVKYRNNRKLRIKNEEISKLIVEKRMAALQLENLRSQMNPHFIFNALNSIQEYIVNNEKKLASAYLVKFSRLMRLYLEQSKVNEITLAEELQTLELYLTLEANRFENQLNYSVTISHDLDGTIIAIPSLLLQPFIDNAIKHGLAHKKGLKTLTITFSKTDNFLEVSITDNGVGRAAAEAINQRKYPFHKSFATEASNDRIRILNNSQQQKIKVTYTDLNPGTQVTLLIPLKPFSA